MSLPIIADITAIESAPEFRTVSAFVLVMPPIATMGMVAWFFICFRVSSPMPCPASFFVAVLNMGPMPRYVAPSVSACFVCFIVFALMPMIFPLNIFFASLIGVSVWPKWMPSAWIFCAIVGWSLIIRRALCFFVRVFSFFAVFRIRCSGRFFSRYWIIFMPASRASFVSFSVVCFVMALSVIRYSFGIFVVSMDCHRLACFFVVLVVFYFFGGEVV